MKKCSIDSDLVYGSNKVFLQLELANESIDLAELGNWIGLTNRLIIRKELGGTGSKKGENCMTV